jgi:Tol biopolymer transport system component
MQRAATKSVILGSALAFALTASMASIVTIAEDRKTNELLQSGLTRETIQGDLKGAIALYEQAAKEAGPNRSLAAKAQLRLGAAYQKLGDAQARSVFERVVRDYADQPEAADARARLNALGKPAVPAPAPTPTLTEILGIRGRGAPGRIRQITLYDREGKVLATVGEPAPNGTITLSPDGRKVAVVKDAAIVVYDVATKAMTKLTPGPGDNQPTWSPDGSRIAFQVRTNQPSRPIGIYVVASDGKGTEEMFTPFSDLTLISWTYDGRFLTYQAPGSTTGADLWVLPLAPERKPIPVLRTPLEEQSMRISPDGRFIAYKLAEAGRSDVYVRRFDSENPGTLPSEETWKVSVDPGSGRSGVRWRADGKELYYISSSGGVMAIDITTTPAFKAGTPRLLFQTPDTYHLSPSNAAGFSDVSADGQIFALSVPQVMGLLR